MKYLHNRVKQYHLGSLPEGPIPALEQLSRESAAEGMVLVRNEHNTLPLVAGDSITLFGRSQIEYCKSGTGSGGLVNVHRVISILDAFREEHPEIQINEELVKVYTDWLIDHPFDKGKGWAQEPWCQVEMPLTDAQVAAAAKTSNKAVVVIGRTAGEDKDNSATKGSWYLTDAEEEMLELVSRHFAHVAVVLNVGNIIDMSWVEKYGIDSVLYGWQGGMCGGAATVDILCGTITPSGKLTDTIARIEDYPSTANFGDPARNLYQEDIYVGYRYFETFAAEKVLYPFGFGLSYTTFDLKVGKITLDVDEIESLVTVNATVTNTGDRAGKEVVQVYLGAPQGKLGKPSKVLTAFAKTELLQPGESEKVRISFHLEEFASYDDSGVTGHKSCYVLEGGQYLVYVGTDVRNADAECAFSVEERVVEVCTEALAPTVAFERMRPDEDGSLVYEAVPTRTYDLAQRILDNRPESLPLKEQGIKLVDVRDGRATMEEFIAQLTDEELLEISRGEGMSSPKVTPGTGGCFGGVTKGLIEHGIPIACVTDGPSGLRLDSGLMATSLPNGTCLAATWNLPLIYDLFVLEGVEMTAYKIDALLGPGINIHRSPLNGRNFEYFSEDPYLTGMMASAMCQGTRKCGVDCTIKHFAANNQEWKRHETDSVMSERAAREIYLKPFEIAVKLGDAESIMTSYNLINGLHGASCYDLTTTILRGEWGYKGFVMTDWWANMNEEGGKSSHKFISLMVRAQNDVFMLDAVSAGREDDGKGALENGTLTRGELQRTAMNLCRYLMRTHAMERFLAAGSTYSDTVEVDLSDKTPIHLDPIPEVKGRFKMKLKKGGKYVLVLSYHAGTTPLAQIPISIIQMPHRVGFVMVQGTEGAAAQVMTAIDLKGGESTLRLVTNNGALQYDSADLYIL